MPTTISAFLRRSYALILSIALMLISVFTVNISTAHAATTWTVNTLNDDAAGGTCSKTSCTLRDALNSAASGDTIVFTGLAGTITLGTAGTLIISKNVDILGTGPGKLAIDGGKKVTVFTVSRNAVASISELTIRNGRGSSGGGILIDYGRLTLNSVTLSANFAGEGGAIENYYGTLEINHSTLSDNFAGYGGGIENHQGILDMLDSTLSGNFAGYGGGIYSFGPGTINIAKTTLTNNSASSGGGLYNYITKKVSINYSTFAGNSANLAGGGLYNYNGTITISNSTLTSNSSTGSGGEDVGNGGAVFNGGTVAIGNSTVSGNSASGSGGGIFAASGYASLLSDIVAKNTATVGDPDISPGVQSLGYNLIGSASTSIITTGDHVGSSDNSLNPPIDPMLRTLSSNSGSTQTMAITSSSPAYQKGFCGGSNGITPVLPAVTTDQRGLPRKGTSTGCDVGAYEVPFPGSFATPAVTSTPSR